jgi:integrase
MARGSIGKRGRSWYYAHRVDDPETGSRRQKWQGGFATKKDADRALREALAAVETGIWIEPSKLTYGDYVEQVWLPALERQVESSTQESYSRNMRLHVLPKVGGLRLQRLTPNHLNELYRQLLEEPKPIPEKTNRRHDSQVYAVIDVLRQQRWSYGAIAMEIQRRVPSEDHITRHAVARIVARSMLRVDVRRSTLSVRTVRYVHTIISKSLRDAIRLGIVNQNAAANASPPRPPKTRPERKLWTADQTRCFLQWSREVDHPLWEAWAFVATSGDRRGANLGLRWQDIDFDSGTASLIWTVTAVSHKIVVKPYGKTGKPHEIILDKSTLAMLRSLKARQAQEQIGLGSRHVCTSTRPDCPEPGYHNRDLVFCRPDGNYLQPERFTREFQRGQERYNAAHPNEPLPKVNLHALRHGWATLALEAGVPMKVIQDRLNHASERITADIYTHVRRPMQSDAADRVASLIFGSN